MKIVQALEDSDISSKKIAEKIENETKERKAGFLGMLLGTLDSSLLGNMLTGKEILRAGYGNKQGKGVVRDGSGFFKKNLNSIPFFNKHWNTEVLSE